MQIFDFFKKKPVEFVKFCDSFGNFEITYPKNWHFDKNIAVVDGQYTNSFYSNDSNFTISVNAKIYEKFNFKKYAKQELESPSSGILTKPKKSKFLGMPSYNREYSYHSDGKEYFGGGIMFFTGRIVFSLNWNAPKYDKEKKKIFDQMISSLKVVK
ncbi:MAG: hypothetical protein ABH842_01975 [Candidatus Micrarchaeota archaeon]